MLQGFIRYLKTSKPPTNKLSNYQPMNQQTSKPVNHQPTNR
jgi:hypothetical protein